MTWTKIYNKICKLKLFIDFTYWLDVNTDFRPISKIRDCNIKDIFGYVICFADEMKGYSMISDLQTAYYNDASKTWLHLEPSMVWCIEEFFEVCK